MDAEDLLEIASDPVRWYLKSVVLRRSGDALWERFFAASLDSASDQEDADSLWSDWDEAIGYLGAAQFLYGLALETALKGHILDNNPEDITFKIEADGSRQVRAVQVTQFGVSMGAGHDLEKLAGKVGLLSRTDNPVFKHESDVRALQEILKFLTETIVWSGRYPVPLRSGEGHQLPADVPPAVFAHYMRDWIDPVLDHYQGEHWIGSADGTFNRLMQIAEQQGRERRAEDHEGS